MTKRKALIVGAGSWARFWARAVSTSDRAQVGGWVDIRPDAAKIAAEELGVPGIFAGADVAEAIEKVSPDFVLNVTAPWSHAQVAIQALDAGLPVLSEKPMAESLHEARLMIRASEWADKLLMINQQRTHDPRLAAMRALLDEQTGPLGMLDCDFYRAHPEAQFHQEMISPLLYDMAVHAFDAARFLSAANAVSVYCEDFHNSWSWWHGKDSAIAVFEMTGGVRFSYRGSWSAHGWETTWESSWRAVGPKGTVRWKGIDAPVAEVVDESEPNGLRQIQGQYDPLAPNDIAASLNDFLTALDTGVTPLGECHDNIQTLAMTLAAVQSAELGRRIEIQPLLDE